MHAVRHAQCYTLRTPSSTTVPWPGDYIELDVPPNLGEDHVLALQPITDTPVPKHTKTTSIWPEPQTLEAVSAKVHLVNSNLNSSTSFLGWIWSQGRLSANPHRIAAFWHCVLLLQL